HALPVLFINMGGEMLYILDQRLHAQKIDNEKARKVLNDIVGTMFNKRFMEELFRPQELPAKQALFCTYKLLALLDKQLGYGDWQAMRHCLMNFFQRKRLELTLWGIFDALYRHAHSSVNLSEGGHAGQFWPISPAIRRPLPAGFAKLGNVQLYTNRGKPLQPASFSVKQFNGQSREGSADMRGDRGTSLGCNMYAGGQVDTSAPPTQQPTGSESRQQQKQQQRSKGAPTPQLVAAPSDLDSYQVIGRSG
uniref:PI3K/PI4K domain-containing protein n=1 Tax=Macrostomum lignano TaxID=282301 RepID=A0A1I8HZG2_9PLAT